MFACAGLTEQDVLSIIEKYSLNKINSNQIAKLYNVSSDSIRKILRNNKIEIRNSSECHRKYEVNNYYFEKVDTEDKAYFLGLFYADGYVNLKSNYIQLGLKEDDIDILHSFREYIGFNGNIRFDLMNNKTKFRRIIIQSQRLCNDLNKLGCFQKKSLILKFPNEQQVPNHLLNHFVRGYFDGDGYISCGIKQNNEKYVHVSITSTLDFCLVLKHTVYNSLGVKSSIHKTPTNDITKNITVGGFRSCILLLDWLYDKSTIFLKRKHNKYIKAKNMISL